MTVRCEHHACGELFAGRSLAEEAAFEVIVASTSLGRFCLSHLGDAVADLDVTVTLQPVEQLVTIMPNGAYL